MVAPKMYMSSIIMLLKTKGSSLNIEDIEEEMCELYIMCIINDEKDDYRDDDSEKETALNTPGYFGQNFGWKCYIFHQSGHKAHECPSENKNNEGGGYKGGRSGGGS